MFTSNVLQNVIVQIFEKTIQSFQAIRAHSFAGPLRYYKTILFSNNRSFIEKLLMVDHPRISFLSASALPGVCIDEVCHSCRAYVPHSRKQIIYPRSYGKDFFQNLRPPFFM